MKPRLIAILVAGAFVPAFAQAQESGISGSVSLGARHSADSANDPSKLNEYRDIGSGNNVFGGFELRGRAGNSYSDAYGENIGRDDQYVNAGGGSYGVYRYRLYSDQLRHNFGSGPGARSPFAGIGSASIGVATPTIPVATWNTFNHSYTRRDLGGMFELQVASPWYFRADVNEVKRDGINVFAGAKGTSPGNGFMDLPSPIKYTTRNYTAEVGYSTRRGHVAVSYLHSSFDNGNEVLRWANDFFSGLDTTVLPPSNDLNRLAINGNLRGLAMDSTLAGRFTRQNLTNDVRMQTTMLSTGGASPATNPSDANFKGDITKTTASLSLASHVAANLDTKLYWNYIKEENESTDVTFNPAVGSGLRGGSTDPLVNCANVAGVLCTPELFHYKKDNYGLEAGYRLGRGHKLSGGVDYMEIDRERVDFPKTKDWKFFAEWKSSALDWATGRVKYQYLKRDSDFEASRAVLAANPMDGFVRRFDLANVQQNMVKVALDATPAGGLDLGFEFILKDNNYKDTILGRTSDTRQEYYASVGFGDANRMRVLVFGDVEYVEYESFHRVGTGNPDPATAPNTTTYNWTAKNKDNAWQVGIGLDWKPMTRFTVKSSLIYAETNGDTDFTVQPGGPTLNSLGLPFPAIRNNDNTKRTSLNLRGVYEWSRNWEFTAGYAYESYRYSDIGYDNTRYVAGTGTSAAYTTGQFAFQPYSVNIVYGLIKYKFGS